MRTRTGRRRWPVGIVVGVVGAVLGWPGVAGAAAASGCATPQGVYQGGTPWPQQVLDLPGIWPLSRGGGQLVAVLGTGVDAANAQFAAGQVRPAIDLVGGQSPSGTADCDGRGTFAAGIVAARPDPATTFTGVAPDADILPIRDTQTTGDGSRPPDPGTLATAVTDAVAAHATVILVVVPSSADSAALRAAVRDALAAGVVVVSPAVGGQAGAVSYPTAQAGVIGVGGLSQDGKAVQTERDDVALAAPGAGLVSTSAGAAGRLGMRWDVTDPGFAAAYVAGTAALLRAYQPSLTPAQILTRLEVTAGRPPNGAHDPWLGWGTLDAYAAVAADLPAAVPAPGGGASPPARRVAPMARTASPSGTDRTPGDLALLGVCLAALGALAAAAIRRARLRHWRPGRAHETTEPPR